MKLNIECIRDILLYLEKETVYETATTIFTDKENELTNKYGSNVIRYHIRQCDQYGYLLNCRVYDAGDQFLISDITPKAHEFIANTRNDKNWTKVKNTLNKIGSCALDIVERVASAVVVAQINQHL